MTHRVLFTSVLLLGAALRLWGLGAESLWHDESWTWYLVKDSLGDLFHRLAHNDAHPPGYFLLIWPWAKLGDSEAMLRFPSALLGIASLPLLYRLTRSLAGAREGLIAMAFLAVAPFHVKYSQEARSYAMLFFLCLLSLDLLCAVRQSPDRRWLWTALAAVTAAIVYVEYLGIFFIAGEVLLAAAWCRGDGLFLRRCLSATAGSLLLFLPWMPTALRHVFVVGGGFWMPKPTPEVLGTELSQLMAYPYGQTAFMKALCSVPAAALALAAPVLTRRRELWPWVLAAFVPVLLQIGVGFFVTIFCGRGLIFVLAPILALAALSAGSLGKTTARIAAVALVLLGAWPGLRYLHGELEKEDWRSAVGELRRQAKADDVVLVHEGYLDVSVYYYFRPESAPRIIDVEAGGLAGILLPIEEAAAAARRSRSVWIVRRTYRERPELPDLLTADFPVQRDSRWRHVSVLSLSR